MIAMKLGKDIIRVVMYFRFLTSLNTVVLNSRDPPGKIWVCYKSTF